MYGEPTGPTSARGQAIALLEMPMNLLIFEGVVLAIGGLMMIVIGFWPVVFNGAPLNDEAIAITILGLFVLGWGALICYGASRMEELSSYNWAVTGAVVGVVPLFVGLYALLVLTNPTVRAGFAERAAGITDDEDDD